MYAARGEPASARRIRRLHLRASGEGEAATAATLLADALRIASLPGADRPQLVVVRHLPLGRVDPRASAASVALQIEGAAREAIATAVAYDAPSAQHANAVVFPQRSAAIAELARLHARATPAGEWFWNAVVPGWNQSTSVAARWQLLLDAAHRTEEGVLTAAAIAHQAACARALNALLAALAPGMAARYLRAGGWTTTAPVERRTTSLLPERHAAVIDGAQDAWGAASECVVWAAAMLAVHERPERAADRQLPAVLAAALIERRARTAAAAAGCDAAGPVKDTPGPPAVTVAAPPEALTPDRPSEVEDLTAPSGDSATSSGQRTSAKRPTQDIVRSDEIRASAPPIVDRCGCYTEYAGLFFVVSILARLRFGSYVARHERYIASAFASRLLLYLARRTGLPAGDPLLAAHAAGFDLDRGAGVAEPDLPFAPWYSAVRGWCRRRAAIDLKALVHRPGRVHVGPTHVDVSFGLRDADPTIRRLALDVDPGWVPWLGRVVQFHYLDDGRR